MLDVTVKTLDGQNKSYSIPETTTVRQFKEKIASSINIEADVQRLIFQGRVLQDEKLMKEYDVHGKVIHVVHRPPPSSRASTQSTASSTPGGLPREFNNITVGSFTLPSEVLDPNQIQNIVQQAVSGMGDMGRNAQVSTRSNADGSSIDVHINLGQMPAGAVESEAQLRINQARRMLDLATNCLNRLENPSDNSDSQGPSIGPGLDTITSSPSTVESSSTSDRNASPMDTSENTDENTVPSVKPTSSTPSADAATNTSSRQTQEQGAQTTTGATPTQTRTVQRPNIRVLRNLLQEITAVNTRMQPHMDRYMQLLADDPVVPPEEVQSSQRLCNLLSEAIHALSHCYHSVSDIFVDMHREPPRELYTPIFTSAIIQQSIPVQVRVGSPALARRNLNTSQPQPTRATSASSPVSTSSPASNTGTTSVSQTSTSTTSNPVNVRQIPVSTGMANVTSTDPVVFVEVGPESVTVNSISAHMMSTEEESTSPPTTPVSSESGSTQTTSRSATTTASTTNTSGAQPQVAGFQIHGIPSGAQISQDVIQGIVSSMMQAHGGPGSNENVQFSMSGGSVSSAGFMPSPFQMPMNGSGSPAGGMRMPQAIHVRGFPPGVMRLPTNLTHPMASPISRPATSVPAGNPRSTSAGAPTVSSGGNTSTAGSQTRGPSYTASTTQTPIGTPRPPGATLFRPGLSAQQGGGLPGVRPIDPYLQCQSRHFLRLQAQQLNQNGDTAFGDVVSSIMTGVLGQPLSNLNPGGNARNPFSTSPSTGSSETPASSSTGTAASHTRTTASAQTGPIPANPFAGLFSQFGGMGGMGGIPRPVLHRIPTPFNPPTAGPNPTTEPGYVQDLRSVLQSHAVPPTSASQQQEAPPPPQQSQQSQNDNENSASSDPPLSDEAFTQLVRGVTSYVTQSALGQSPQDTVFDFLQNLGENYNIGPGEGIINDVFHCISRHLTFPDLIAVLNGNPAQLNRIRNPLKEFIHTKILENSEPTEDNIELAVERLVDGLREDIETAVGEVEVRPGIDLCATLEEFFRRNLKSLLTFIINTEENDDSFGQNIYNRCNRIMAEIVVLNRHCLTGGLPAFERLVQGRLQHLTQGVNPMIQQWMSAMTSHHLQNFVPNITITEEDVQSYIVKKSARDRSPPNVPMDTSPVSSSPLAENQVPTSSTSRVRKEPMVNGTAERGPENTTKNSRKMTNGEVTETNGWEEVLPPDWVPVISQDVNRQKMMSGQAPLSDTYLQGMPAKKRKLMTSDRPETIANMTDYVQQSLRRAVASAGVDPVSSLENMSNEAAEDSSLHMAMENHIKESISERLDRDSDFSSDRFPNAEEYYKKKK